MPEHHTDPSTRAAATTSRSLLQPNLDRGASLRLILACGLIMAAGWGIRGSFGHSRGAMMPGAMLGLTLAACSLRSDWWHRSAILGFLAMIGWGFGGVSSYGLLVGYSMGGTYTNSLYGLSSLFLVGSLYSGIGAGFLALGLTERRRMAFPFFACWDCYLHSTPALTLPLGSRRKRCLN